MADSDKIYDTTQTVLNTNTATAGTAKGDESSLSPAKPFAARSFTVTVDFGAQNDDDEADMASTLVKVTKAGPSWVLEANKRPVCHVVGRPGVSGLDDEDALLDQVSAIVTNIVDNVSFDVVAFAPEGTTGQYTVHVLGV